MFFIPHNPYFLQLDGWRETYIQRVYLTHPYSWSLIVPASLVGETIRLASSAADLTVLGDSGREGPFPDSQSSSWWWAAPSNSPAASCVPSSLSDLQRPRSCVPSSLSDLQRVRRLPMGRQCRGAHSSAFQGQRMTKLNWTQEHWLNA